VATAGLNFLTAHLATSTADAVPAAPGGAQALSHNQVWAQVLALSGGEWSSEQSFAESSNGGAAGEEAEDHLAGDSGAGAALGALLSLRQVSSFYSPESYLSGAYSSDNGWAGAHAPSSAEHPLAKETNASGQGAVASRGIILEEGSSTYPAWRGAAAGVMAGQQPAATGAQPASETGQGGQALEVSGPVIPNTAQGVNPTHAAAGDEPVVTSKATSLPRADDGYSADLSSRDVPQGTGGTQAPHPRPDSQKTVAATGADTDLRQRAPGAEPVAAASGSAPASNLTVFALNEPAAPGTSTNKTAETTTAPAAPVETETTTGASETTPAVWNTGPHPPVESAAPVRHASKSAEWVDHRRKPQDASVTGTLGEAPHSRATELPASAALPRQQETEGTWATASMAIPGVTVVAAAETASTAPTSFVAASQTGTSRAFTSQTFPSPSQISAKHPEQRQWHGFGEVRSGEASRPGSFRGAPAEMAFALRLRPQQTTVVSTGSTLPVETAPAGPAFEKSGLPQMPLDGRNLPTASAAEGQAPELGGAARAVATAAGAVAERGPNILEELPRRRTGSGRDVEPEDLRANVHPSGGEATQASRRSEASASGPGTDSTVSLNPTPHPMAAPTEPSRAPVSNLPVVPAVEAASGTGPGSAQTTVYPDTAAATSHPATAESAFDPRVERIEALRAARPAYAARDISLRVGGGPGGSGENGVDVRIVDREGEVRFAVRTPNGTLLSSLRENLGDLLSRFDQAGYHAESWQPASGRAPYQEQGSGSNHNPSAGQQSPGDSREQGQPQQQREDAPPEWLEEFERQRVPAASPLSNFRSVPVWHTSIP
jgi:hypothetical protein